MNRVRCISVHFHLQRRKEHTCREITIKIYVTSTHQVKTCMVISMKTLPRVFSRKRVHRAWSEEQANTKELHLVCFQTFLHLRLRECSFSIELIHHHRELKTTSRPKGDIIPCFPQLCYVFLKAYSITTVWTICIKADRDFGTRYDLTDWALKGLKKYIDTNNLLVEH